MSARLKVYYDGLCHLCSREINHYAGVPGSQERIEFVDISDPSFDPRAEGVDALKVQKYFHAKRGDGTVLVGLDAFMAMWRVTPGYHWLATLAGLPVIKPMLQILYAGFAEVRPLLPKRQTSCPLPKSPVTSGRT
jgi:predicted DCC family thiol-disulfide oxidoreductase YuxK